MNGNSLSGIELEKALTEGNLTQAQAYLTGMVKPSENSGHISFSLAGCDAWVDLPTDMIERADQQGQRPCRDHSHPVMRIALKEPKDAQGKILAALLMQTATRATPETVHAASFPVPQVQGESIPATRSFAPPPHSGPNTGFVDWDVTPQDVGPTFARAVNWRCRTSGGLCPMICYPIVVDGRLVGRYCFCDCRFPVPDNLTVGLS